MRKVKVLVTRKVFLDGVQRVFFADKRAKKKDLVG